MLNRNSDIEQFPNENQELHFVFRSFFKFRFHLIHFQTISTSLFLRFIHSAANVAGKFNVLLLPNVELSDLHLFSFYDYFHSFYIS